MSDLPLHPDPLPTCLHRTSGLCPRCLADYRENPEIWLEYGAYPEGQKRWRECLDDLARLDEPGPVVDPAYDMPF
jgi:hypothetical protein